ncbi:MAG: response regulator [Planctomycetota bacterium]
MPIRVLLAEDDEDHVLLLRRALRRYPRPVRIDVARDGQEALELLQDSTAQPPPVVHLDLIILDINMPKLTGLEVLRAVKSDPDLTPIPTIMLTTSAREEDRRASIDGGADEFLTKPVNFQQFSDSLFALLDRFVVQH